jgi:hypothetical protein
MHMFINSSAETYIYIYLFIYLFIMIRDSSVSVVITTGWTTGGFWFPQGIFLFSAVSRPALEATQLPHVSIHLHLVLRLRMHGALHSLLRVSSGGVPKHKDMFIYQAYVEIARDTTKKSLKLRMQYTMNNTIKCVRLVFGFQRVLCWRLWRWKLRCVPKR